MPKTTVIARIFAYSIDEELISVRVLLDNGSHCSYITNDLSARLGLKAIKRERLTINAFGSENYNKRECNLIRVKMQGKLGNDIEILALGFPVICLPLKPH